MTFPTVKQTLMVEFLISGVWTDVTNLRPTYNCYILGLSGGSDDNPAITIKRTKKSGIPVITTTVQFAFFDPNAIMDNSNPLSPFYGKIPPGTQIRVSVDGTVRMPAAIDSVVPDFTGAPRVITVDFTCTGVWDTIAFGDKPLNSPIHRSTVKANPVDYWRLEEGVGSTQFLNTIPGGSPSDGPRGAISLAADNELGGSLPNPKMGANTYVGFPIRQHTFNGHYQLDWFMHMEGERAVDTTVMRLRCADGTIAYWDFVVGNNTHYVRGYNSAGTAVVASPSFVTADFMVTGWAHYRLMAHDIGGGTIEWLLVEFPVPTATGQFITGTYAGTLGRPYLAQLVQPAFQPNPAATLDGMGYGHVVVYDDYNFSAVDGSGSGYTGERAMSRAFRICTEEGIPFAVSGNVNDTVTMGPQPVDTTANILIQCAQADDGMLYDSRNSWVLVFKSRASMYSQSATLNLAYNQSHLSDPFAPVVGGVLDTTIQNDYKAERKNGGSARYTIPDGDFDHWTTESPPDGVRTREGGNTFNLATDDLLNAMAGWKAHLASWKEKRFTEITVERHRAAIAGNSAISAAIWNMDMLNLIALDTTGASRWIPQNETRMLMEGRTDTLAQFGHKTVFVTRPADPYEVPGVNTSGSTLVVAVNTAATSLKLDTSLGPEWSTVDTPYHTQADGEAMRVTAMSTDTPVFIGVGTVAHANNATVTPGLPAGMTPDVGQLMILQAAIRSSGTGTPNTPAGWTQLVANSGNMRVYGRYYVTGDTAPNVSFSGGVGGDDTSARIVAFSGLSMRFGGSFTATGKQSPGNSQQLNGSAQDIKYPPYYIFRDKCVVLVFGWKQDDWTSVATLAGFTELWEDFTTPGNDQGIVADYQIQGGKANIPAGSFVVTGGVAAISRGSTIALRPLQTATVVRGVNGINVSHAAGAAVRGWRMGVNGL